MLILHCDRWVYWWRMFVCVKQKTAYEMRISDWSSDVCSSDLGAIHMSRAARNAGAGIDDARPLQLAREDRVAERQRGTVAVAEIAHGGEAGAQRLHPVRLGIEGLGGGTERDFIELADRKSTRLNYSHYCAARMPDTV